MIKGRMSFTDAAHRILSASERRFIHYDDLTQEALKTGLIHTDGETPHNSMNAALRGEIQRNWKAARFISQGEGLYGLSSAGRRTEAHA